MELDTASQTQKQPVLPTLVFGVVEVRRLQRELEALDDYFSQNALRQPGKQVALPRTSRLLDSLAGENHVNLLQAHERQSLAKFLQLVVAQAPNIHISFAADPSSAFTAKLVSWLRSNIHPFALLQLGLQPNIAAGCVVRTPNRVFDFSLRQRFTDQHQLLLQALEAK
ncbi:MAG TPA: hypothetical protein VMY99_02560 [Nevskiaceae bacterium]|nr:hypothetical protein [Nevskiaceae bacterium]